MNSEELEISRTPEKHMYMRMFFYYFGAQTCSAGQYFLEIRGDRCGAMANTSRSSLMQNTTINSKPAIETKKPIADNSPSVNYRNRETEHVIYIDPARETNGLPQAF
jgi:hypothetical protein